MTHLCRRRTLPAQDLHHARHPHVTVADAHAPAAPDAGDRELPLDEVVVELVEEPPVAPVVDRLARVVAAGHAREPTEGARVPDAHALELALPNVAVRHGEAGAGRTDVAA